MKILRNLVLGISALLISAAACGEDKIPVVASFSILGDLVAAVGGEHVAVQTLVGPDQDAHVFDPRPADIRTVAQAKLVVMNGLGFEGWMTRLTKSANFKGTELVASRGIKPRKMDKDDHGDAHEHRHGHDHDIDPHAWQDPRNVLVYVRNIVDALSKIDPAHRSAYQENGRRYSEALQALDTWAVEQYASIPGAKRKLITSHAAFGYHSARYGIRFLSPQGASTESEPSAKEVSRLIRQIKQEKIKAVFMENMSSPRLLEQLANEAEATPSGKLYADALSAAGGPAPSYLEMMRYNVTQLVAALKRN